MTNTPTYASIVSGDGTVDRIWRRPKQPVAAIFIHAGAGYHSVANESVHLQACNEAARVGMRFLRAGASAPEAIEAAIKCLEDKEITNAGFGSNLNMDGVVECDATVVDHLGRSGACGAVPGIKNPISLAKMILDASSQPLSLRRVPPNILVGTGAKAFAEERGMPATLNDYLVSKNAKDRYLRWNEDLRKAEARLTSSTSTPSLSRYPIAESKAAIIAEYERAGTSTNQGQFGGHTAAILTGTWNEGQPDSPYPPSSAPLPLPTEYGPTPTPSLFTPRPHQNMPQRTTPPGGQNTIDRNPLNYVSSTFQSRMGHGSFKRPKVPKSMSDDSVTLIARTSENPLGSPAASGHDGASTLNIDLVLDNTEASQDLGDTWTSTAGLAYGNSEHGEPAPVPDFDTVTDTIGAIAIDLKGRIAAGSSSGGIGMKHTGRIGPAALVGIGTAVIPADLEDDNHTSVAAVTSGTGEHMATTLASAKCAERLFSGTRRGPGGRDVEELDEHALMEAFILDDFMGHPGVKHQPSTGAIGVMAVKKERTGIYFYFAHNTDSFALASMSSTEREPVCVMSRLGKARPVAQGARRIRVD